MTTLRKTMISCFCLLLMAMATKSEPWRGIVPLRSTKSDVERLLGKPSEATDKLLTYRFETETVLIYLITEETPGVNPAILRPGVVKDIEVIPKQTVRLADLGLDEKRIVFIKGSKPGFLGFSGYVDEQAGLIVKLNEVPRIFYFASARDRGNCPSCSVDPQSLADIPVCILCPMVVVSCSEQVDQGTATTFASNVTTGSPPPKLTWNWTVNFGKIVEGQGGSMITVDTTNLKSDSITATVEVGGIDPACSRTASCSTKLNKRPNERSQN
jgi:hypothetical protein